MKRTKVLVYACLSAVALFLSYACIGPWRYETWDRNLPPERLARQQFENHRADFIRIVKLLRKDQSAKYVGGGRTVDIDRIDKRPVPEYRELIHQIGAKFVQIREDGSMEFALWGHGGAIMSDSYMGVRLFPKDHALGPVGWRQKVVASLDSAKLPQEHGSVATGLYIVKIDPEWFIYRLEIQE